MVLRARVNKLKYQTNYSPDTSDKSCVISSFFYKARLATVPLCVKRMVGPKGVLLYPTFSDILFRRMNM